MTASPPLTDLTDRARTIFQMVVESYLAEGLPVGSRTLAQHRTLNLSPASIRSVLQDLEEVGLLAAPHTSAGRVPTEQGLRLFVDGMMQMAGPSAQDRAQIEAMVASNVAGPVETALANASAALSDLSACAGLVMVPGQQGKRLRQVAFVPLNATQALVVLVADDGSIENRVIDIPADLPQSALVEAGNFITHSFAGLSLDEAQARLRADMAGKTLAMDRAAAGLVERGLAVWSADGNDRPVLIVRGQAHLIDEAATQDIERVRLLLDELETQQEIAHLLASAGESAATRIFIGSENKLFALSGSSVIAAPWRGVDGRVIGVVGVIGPTRLNYARIVPMVDFTAQTLSRLMR